MENLVNRPGSVFWSENFWLPPKVTWQYFEGDQRFAQFHHLLFPIPSALLFILIRIILERIIFRPLGKYLGLKDTVTKKKETELDLVLNKAIEESGQSDSYSLSKKTGIEQRSIDRWVRRKNKKRTSNLDKFCETGWRWAFYLFAHIMGLVIMWDKIWTWDIVYCWWEYPRHYIDPQIWWYYMIELTFYWSLCFSQCVDVKRKDFWEMFTHHITTIALMVFSWTCHMHRVGSLVLLIHDFADHWLELAKLARYVKYQKVCDTVFGLFAITWIYTRLAVYPVSVIYSTSIEAGQLLEVFPAYYVFNFLLTLLLILHLMWAYFILKVAYKALLCSSNVKDSRSHDESSSD